MFATLNSHLLPATLMKAYYVYILANKRNGTLYIGVTNDLVRRVYAHKNGFVDGFTKKYCVHKLVHYEQFTYVHDAITREKTAKKMESRMEIKINRTLQPRLERSLFRHYKIKFNYWIPAFAGMTPAG